MNNSQPTDGAKPEKRKTTPALLVDLLLESITFLRLVNSVLASDQAGAIVRRLGTLATAAFLPASGGAGNLSLLAFLLNRSENTTGRLRADADVRTHKLGQQMHKLDDVLAGTIGPRDPE